MEDKELSDLEPLDELEPLVEVAPLAELPDDADALPALAPAPAGEGAAKRELERAPLLLRKAALIVAAGSILPWASIGDVPAQLAWWGTLFAKGLLLAAIWVFYQSHVAAHGGRVASPLAALAGSLTIGKLKLNGLALLALVLALAGLWPWGETGGFLFASLSEKLILLLAGYTFAHIYDYEHGGRFNPIYPLMFLAPALGGLFAIFRSGNVVGIAGSAAVCVGGCFACYTLGVAMHQAKKEGDAKRAAHLQARKAAREARRTVPGAGSPAAGSPAAGSPAAGRGPAPRG